MRIIRSTGYRRMKWKNRGGETIEIAVSPPGASLEDFHWRVSMAHVATAGPFSIFPGVDRTLAVIAGAGITLHVAGRGAVRLGQEEAPFAFPGDLPVEAALVGGAIDDLNVMTRRGRHRHLLSRIRTSGAINLPRHGDIMIVIARRSGATLRAVRQAESLAAQDAAILDESDGARVEIAPDGDAELLVIDLWRC
jgi:environmental stress-induced protein Ves